MNITIFSQQIKKMSVQDKFEYTKVIINLKSKDRQYHRQNKQKNNKTNHFLQNTTQNHD